MTLRDQLLLAFLRGQHGMLRIERRSAASEANAPPAVYGFSPWDYNGFEERTELIQYWNHLPSDSFRELRLGG